MILFISRKSMFYIIFFILCIWCGPRSYLCVCTLLCNLPLMKKIWGHSGKCRTMRVITATLRNGQMAVASGGLKGGESFLRFSCWFPHRAAWTRIMLLAWYQDPVPDVGLRRSIHDIVIASGNGYRLFEEGVARRIIRIARFKITDVADPW